MALEATAENFQREVLESQVPVLVDFWAEWCPPCRVLSPTIDQLSTEADGRFKVLKLNVDQFPDIATTYGVSSIPTCIAFRGGQPTNRTVGAQPKAKLLEALGV